MTKFLDNLRTKPLQTRKKIAVVSSCGIFAAIFLIWWFSFSAIKNDDHLTSEKTPSPLDVIANVFQVASNGVKDLPSKIQNQLNHVPSSVDPYGSGKTDRSDIVYPNQLMSGAEMGNLPSATSSN